ncbi:MAG: hypothetical protein WA421_03925, partial [Nitrososphaeraceae archaeon]
YIVSTIVIDRWDSPIPVGSNPVGVGFNIIATQFWTSSFSRIMSYLLLAMNQRVKDFENNCVKPNQTNRFG